MLTTVYQLIGTVGTDYTVRKASTHTLLTVLPADRSDHEGKLGALAASAAQVLAPNSLQFNEHEFQR